MTRRAIGMFSGGLDSCLAVHLVQMQNIEVVGVTFILGVSLPWEGDHPLLPLAERLGIDLKVIDISDDFIKRVLSPRWSYGTSVNPCVDCKFLMMSKSAELMKEHGAEFVFTGEVLGQRPMTQNSQIMNLLEKETGLKGRLLRPLCAKLLAPTIPETEEIINRELLLDIQGRSRHRQLTLAEEWKIEGYGQPAGGCVLTNREYGGKVQDMFIHRKKETIKCEDFQILNVGRHFRISADAKLIVGRNHPENLILEKYAGNRLKMEVGDHTGPLALLEGNPVEKDLEIAASITARYSKAQYLTSVTVEVTGESNKRKIIVTPAKDEEINRYRIHFDRALLEEMRRKSRIKIN